MDNEKFAQRALAARNRFDEQFGMDSKKILAHVGKLCRENMNDAGTWIVAEAPLDLIVTLTALMVCLDFAAQTNDQAVQVQMQHDIVTMAFWLGKLDGQIPFGPCQGSC